MLKIRAIVENYKNNELSDDDIDELKQRDISMNAETERVVEPGKTIDKINCYYFDGHYYLKNMDHFNLVEPDIVTVKFIVDGKINTMYYDYSGKSYSYDSETEEADEWSTGEYGDKIPKPDAEHPIWMMKRDLCLKLTVTFQWMILMIM